MPRLYYTATLTSSGPCYSYSSIRGQRMYNGHILQTMVTRTICKVNTDLSSQHRAADCTAHWALKGSFSHGHLGSTE